MRHFIWVFPVCNSTRLGVSQIQRVNDWYILTSKHKTVAMCSQFFGVYLSPYTPEPNTVFSSRACHYLALWGDLKVYSDAYGGTINCLSQLTTNPYISICTEL